MSEEQRVERTPNVPYFGIALAVVAVLIVGFIVVTLLSSRPTNPPVADLYPNGTTAASVPQEAVVDTPVTPTTPTPPPPAPKNVPKVKPPTEKEIAAAKKKGTQHVTISTVQGDIEVDLDGANMPLTVANFTKLAKAKFYNGLTFHRVESGAGFQLIQGGDPMGNGQGGPGYNIKFEKNPKITHEAGVIAMARARELDSAGCQFYITLCPIPALDDPNNSYAVFGRVTKGLDNAKQIAQYDKITKITVK
jgi:cyclophilin family peptidyl-prolyl cis-trans isomerase